MGKIMRKYCFLFIFLILLFLACKQDGNKDIVQQGHPKEFVKTVDGVDFKMIKIEKVKKTTIGKGSGKERVVSLSEFYIAETEVTQALYKAVTGQSPSIFNGVSSGTEIAEGEVQERRPVENINWYEAALFCNTLTEKLLGASECVYKFTNVEKDNDMILKADITWDFSKKGFRLPTEAEFEYAARGGDASLVFAGGSYHVGDPQDKAHEALGELAWYNKNAGSKTHEVRKKLPNAYGIYDMSGNVMEWCNDYYVKPIPENIEKDPMGTDENTGSHTCKGGGFGAGGYAMCTVTGRVSTASDARYDDLGLRVVCRL
jgi:hypothetical protein